MTLPINTGDQLEVDESSSDYSYSNAQSSTESLSSSINRYLTGRRYHAYYGPDKNLMPTDETEQNRLDIVHEIFLLIAGDDLYKAPLQNPQRVLDLGTGTGIWCIDFADKHPEAEVIGVDLSPIQPNWVPNNCKFETDDIELDWTYPQSSFDFIHARCICLGINDLQRLMRQIYSGLKPGAWAQFGENEFRIRSDDGSMPDTWPPKICVELAREAVSKAGRKIPTGAELAQLLTDTGFVDVEVLSFKQPMGPWPKDDKLKQAGTLHLLNSETASHAHGLALFTRYLGMSEEEAMAVCDASHEATLHRAKKEKVHDYFYYFIVYGKKPEH